MMVHKNFSADLIGRRSCLCILQAASILFLVYFVGGVVILPLWRLKTSSLAMTESVIPSLTDGLPSDNLVTNGVPAAANSATVGLPADNIPTAGSLPAENIAATAGLPAVNSAPDICENKCRPRGSESLPEAIVKKVSNLEMRPLWGYPKKRPPSLNLLALSVGIKQKLLVNEMVSKFLSNDFVVMLFHYDGNIDEWKTFEWRDKVIHISVANQTKWWFAKRFLHPDILVDYEYIFLWDEDLGVENFNPRRYMDIVKEEGLHISQPALDANRSEVHHQITARGRTGNVHRRTYKPGECYLNSTAPPCTGWIELMAPVFSKSAWRCVWYLIQNDLIHAWGLDMHLGYCAQGERMQTIGVVDAEYIVHHGLPTLGEPKEIKVTNNPHVLDKRIEVRRQSYNEYKVFRRRWADAVAKDKCWKDPYNEPIKPLF